ncbi:MAG: hypothetical protein MMC23_001133 [Stictis urceolatum]|nr:hypothetical protein [Stictis urceolata]
MKFSIAAALAALTLTVNGAAISKRASNSFAGSNLYFLHGLSADDQANYINTLAGYGAKVIRIWVTGISSGCQKGSNVQANIPNLEEQGIGRYDDTVLEALDKVLAQMAAKGMKAIISPHDGNAFGYNSCDAYCKQYGSGQSDQNSGAKFYQDQTAMQQIDARYEHILNYVSPSSNKKWGDWSDAIFAFDIQNEPFQQASDLAGQNDPSDWLCGRAGNMKKNMGGSNSTGGVLLATGGIGGDQSHGYNLMDKAVQCDAIDIISIHGYVSTANFWTGFLPNSEQTVAAAGKKLFVEEWGVSTSYQDDFDKQGAAITATGTPYTYWQMIPGSDDANNCQSGCCTGFDGFEVGFNSSKGNLEQAIKSANAQQATQDWSGVIN